MSLLSYFTKKGKLTRIKVFCDEKKHIIGLKADDEGYKITDVTTYKSARIKCMPLARITTGEFYPKWSKKDKMLIFSYKDDEK